MQLQHLLKMEPIQCSETSVFNTQTPGNSQKTIYHYKYIIFQLFFSVSQLLQTWQICESLRLQPKNYCLYNLRLLLHIFLRKVISYNNIVPLFQLPCTYCSGSAEHKGMNRNVFIKKLPFKQGSNFIFTNKH